MVESVFPGAFMRLNQGPDDSAWEDACSAYPIGQSIVGTVELVVPFGLFLSTEFPGVRALIRVTDLDPSGAPVGSYLDDLFAVGDDVEAIVVGHLPERSLLASRRLEDYGRFVSDGDPCSCSTDIDAMDV